MLTFDASGNLMTALTKVPALIGPALFYTENDSGALTGTPLLLQPETSADYKLRVGVDTLMFNDSFNATTQNTNLWKNVFATMTLTSGGGTLLFNANSSAAASNGVAYSSWRTFPLIQTTPLYVQFAGYPTVAPLANQVFEFGLFAPTTGIVAPVDGVYLRYTSTGLIGVANFNGVEVTTAVLPATMTPNTQSTFIIVIGQNKIQFWQGGLNEGDNLLATLYTPAALGTPFASYSLPIAMQFRNATTVTGSPQMQWKMNNCSVGLADWATNKPWGHQMCGMGLHSAQGQNGHSSLISTAVAVTGAPAAAAALVQATAAAQFTGLGGIFRVLPTLTSGTEGILCSYQNPVGSVAITPRTLHITGVKIYSAVEVALTGGPLINVYQLCYGHSAVSLAVAADSASFATATAKCARRIPVGMEVYGAAAAQGNQPNPSGLYLDLRDSPIVVNPGEFVAIGLRNQGTVTTAGNLLITVAFTGYWE